MKRCLRIVAMVVAAIVVAIVGAVLLGRLTFERRISQEVVHLFAQRREGQQAIVTERDLVGLPAPVQRWLRWSRVIGTEVPATVRLTQEGRFRLGEDRPWMPFRAEQDYTIDPPGFVWRAAFQMAPLVPIGGRDAYIDGQGSIDMRLLWLIPVAHQRGPELDQGALLRYLNEAVWFPAAALAPSITWEAIDDVSARATISHAGVTAVATFFFDEQGRPVDMRAERYRTVDGGYALSTWSTPFREYGELAGVRVPVAGEGVWKLEGRDFSYIDLRVTRIEYDRSESF